LLQKGLYADQSLSTAMLFSGGLDSVILRLLYGDRPIISLSASYWFEGEESRERTYPRSAAACLSLAHETVDISQEEFCRSLILATHESQRPLPGLQSCLVYCLLSR